MSQRDRASILAVSLKRNLLDLTAVMPRNLTTAPSTSTKPSDFHMEPQITAIQAVPPYGVVAAK